MKPVNNIESHSQQYSNNDYSDDELVTITKGGEVAAYGGLVRRYNQQAYRVARSIVLDKDIAMDIVQEAHIKAFTQLEKFHAKSSFKAWLGGIVRNEALMYLRKNNKEKNLSHNVINLFEKDYAANEADDNRGLPDKLLENSQLKNFINDIIDSLPEDFRLVFVLRAIEQLSVKDTADILSIKPETVKTRFFRAKYLLRDRINKHVQFLGTTVYEFGGRHCDRIFKYVMNNLIKNDK